MENNVKATIEILTEMFLVDNNSPKFKKANAEQKSAMAYSYIASCGEIEGFDRLDASEVCKIIDSVVLA